MEQEQEQAQSLTAGEVSVVDNDVAYLYGLANNILQLSTGLGRQTCAEAAQSTQDRPLLEQLLVAHNRWRDAMVFAVQAIDSSNSVILGALAGEAVGEQSVH